LAGARVSEHECVRSFRISCPDVDCKRRPRVTEARLASIIQRCAAVGLTQLSLADFERSLSSAR
jgi:hypothetical protein